MKRNILILALLLIGTTTIFAQNNKSKWVISTSIDLSSDYNNSYSAIDNDTGRVFDSSLPQKGALEIGGGIDYFLLKRLSIGTTVKYCQSKFTGATLKIGGGLKFFFIRNAYHYFTLECGQKISFDKEVFKNGVQFRLGQYFNVAHIKNSKLMVGAFFSYDDYNLIGAQPMFSKTHKPDYANFHSWGISVGLAF